MAGDGPFCAGCGCTIWHAIEARYCRKCKRARYAAKVIADLQKQKKKD